MTALKTENTVNDPGAGAIKFDAEFALEYDRKIQMSCPGYGALHDTMVCVLNNQPSPNTFLSVGAGTGAEILALGKAFPRCHFVAVDPAHAMIDVCRERLTKAGLTNSVDYFQEKLETYRPARLADAASAIFVSHFIAGNQAKQAFFAQLASCITLGGTLLIGDLIGDPRSPNFKMLFDWWIARLAAEGIEGSDLARARAQEHEFPWIGETQYLDIVEQAGFSRPVRFFQSLLWGGWVAKRRELPND